LETEKKKLQGDINAKNAQIKTLTSQKASLEAGIRQRDAQIKQLQAEGIEEAYFSDDRCSQRPCVCRTPYFRTEEI
jgi:SMC interacting uncharacterized protein involved in chromosome segregation